MQIKSYIKSLPLDPELKRRILMTVSCNDSNYIYKVDHAGEIFTDQDYNYQLMHNGLKVIEGAYHGRGITEIIRLLRGHHEPQEEKAFYEIMKHIREGSTMIELGSHWSYYSMWFQKEVLNAINYMIEPDPNNIEVGKENFRINNKRGFFFCASVGSESSPPKPFECESDNQIRMIPQISVDDFLETNYIDNVEMLFADIQGYELQMLEGAIKSILNRKIRFLFLSTHHHLISNDPIIHHKCLDFLKKYGAHIIVSHTVSESFSGDGLIVASLYENDKIISEILISKNNPTNSLFREIEFDLADANSEIQSLKTKIECMKNNFDLLYNRKVNNYNLITKFLIRIKKIIFKYLIK